MTRSTRGYWDPCPNS